MNSSRRPGDPWWAAISAAILGLALGLRGEIRQGGELLEEARAGFAAMGDEWGAALTAVFLAFASAFAAQFQRAAALARQGLDGFRAAGDQ